MWVRVSSQETTAVGVIVNYVLNPFSDRGDSDAYFIRLLKRLNLEIHKNKFTWWIQQRIIGSQPRFRRDWHKHKGTGWSQSGSEGRKRRQGLRPRFPGERKDLEGLRRWPLNRSRMKRCWREQGWGKHATRGRNSGSRGAEALRDSQDGGAAQTSSSRWVREENVVYIYSGGLLSHERTYLSQW